MNPRSGSILLIFAMVASSARSSDKREPVPELNQKVLAFAREHQGKKVGDGLCVALAVDALNSAGARSFPEPGRDDPDDYTWGDAVEPFEKLLPGDVLQFRDAVFESRDETSFSRRTLTHHTAIVAGVQKTKSGLVVTILHQNTGRPNSTIAERQIVKEARLRFRELQPGGGVKAYRPKRLKEKRE